MGRPPGGKSHHLIQAVAGDLRNGRGYFRRAIIFLTAGTSLDMAGCELPSWAIRLRKERTRRLWSQKVMAVRLRDAADERTRAVLPAIDSIQRYVRDYEAGRHAPGDLYAELYCRAFGLTRAALFGDFLSAPPTLAAGESAPAEYDARSLAAWMASTNISDDGIDHLAQAASALSQAHSQRSPAQLLADVAALHRQIQVLLRSGKQRLRQTRELYRVDADLLAHASLLLGDLHSDDAAAAYGSTAQLCAKEAGANQAVPLSVQAKTARWRMRFASSAELARRGYDCSPATPIRILLACQEANAAALLGDLRRARDALGRAEATARGPLAPDSGVSAWSCPRPRQALFALSVAIQSQDADAALRAAEMADSAWARGDAWVAGTWTQVRLGAGIARIMKDDLDGALAEISPALTLAPEFRMATITGYTSQIDRRLQQRRFLRSDTAAEISGRVRDFNVTALATLTS
jgi:hypothetical protein